MEKFGKFIFELSVATAQVISTGFVFTILWSWFIIPIFHLPILGVAQAIGATTTAKLGCSIIPWSSFKKKQETEDYVVKLLYPWVLLGTAYIVHLFV